MPTNKYEESQNISSLSDIAIYWLPLKKSENFWVPGETLLSIIPKIPHKRVILTLIPIASYLSASIPNDI